MTQPAKRIPDWLTTDLLVIVVSTVIIGIWIWIAPYQKVSGCPTDRRTADGDEPRKPDASASSRFIGAA